MNLMKRMSALLLALVLAMGAVPAGAFAAEPDIKTDEELVSEEAKLNYVEDLGHELAEGFYARLIMTVEETNEVFELKEAVDGEMTVSVNDEGKLQLEVTSFYFPTNTKHKNKVFVFENFACDGEAVTVTETGYVSGRGDSSTLFVTLTRNPGEHSGGEATCVELAKCEFCGAEYGEVDSTNHDFTAWGSNATQHWQICSRDSGHTSEPANHDSRAIGGDAATCARGEICGICKAECSAPLGHRTYVSYVGPNATYENAVQAFENCEGCDHEAEAVVYYDTSAVYTGEAILPVKEIFFPDNWQGEKELDISGSSNVEVGTATLKIGEYEIPFEITPAPLTAKAADASVAYGEAAPEFTVAYEGLLGDDTAADITGEVTFTCEYAPGDPMGTYAITPSGQLSANNYTITFAPGTLTVGKAAMEYTAPEAKELTYNGQSQELVTAGSADQGIVKYSLAENGEYTETIPTGINAGKYTVWYKVESLDDNYEGVGPTAVEVTVAKAKLTPVITGSVTKVYDGTVEVPLENDLTLTLEGMFRENEVAVTHRWEYVSANVGTKAVKVICAALPESATNYELTTAEAVAEVGEITALTIDETAAATMDPMTWNGTEQTAALTSLKMGQVDVTTYQLSGNKATHVGVYKMKVTGTGNFAGEIELEFAIAPDEHLLDGITEANVTSANAEAIKKALAMVKNADTSKFPAEQKAALDAKLKTIEDNAKALEAQLKEATEAASTANITKAKAITAAKAKDTDKTVLAGAKEDLEAALAEYATNYTSEEREAMESEIERLEDILADIAKAEDAVKAAKELPASTYPGDTKGAAAIKAAKDAYNGLTAAQKVIVDNSVGTDVAEKIEDLEEQQKTYKIISGNGSRWSKKSGGTLSFTGNGPLNKFTGIRVDGKAILSKYYTYREGSTIVTLKADYLEKLSLGNHTITIRYEDGEATGSFTVQKQAVTPATGDQFNVALWGGIGGVSLAALVVLLIVMKKKLK